MEERPNPMERRMVLRLLHYWRELGTESSFPRRDQIDPETIAEMWPHCAVLEVAGKEDEPVFAYAGPSLTAGCEVALEGRPVSAAPPGTLVHQALSFFRQVVEKEVPITLGGEFEDHRGIRILYRSIILPLADDGKTIDRLLAAANCREVT